MKDDPADTDLAWALAFLPGWFTSLLTVAASTVLAVVVCSLFLPRPA